MNEGMNRHLRSFKLGQLRVAEDRKKDKHKTPHLEKSDEGHARKQTNSQIIDTSMNKWQTLHPQVQL